MQLFRTRLAAFLSAVLLLAPDSSWAAPPPDWPTSLVMGTASPGGIWVPYGEAVAKILTEALGLPVRAQPSQGTTQNLVLLENGSLQLAMAISAPALESWNGTGSWTKGKQLRAMRVLVPMFDSSIVMVALRSSGIGTSTIPVIQRRGD